MFVVNNTSENTALKFTYKNFRHNYISSTFRNIKNIVLCKKSKLICSQFILEAKDRLT